jgi:hypothetical protein
MISINTKTLQKPYGLYRIQFLTQVFTEAFERKIINTTTNLTDYSTILGPRSIKIFKPEMWEALEDLRRNREAIAIGLAENPPVIVAPIIANENLPIAPPTHTDLQLNATANQIAVWKIKAEITNDFLKAKSEFKDKIKSLIPEEIFKTLILQGGTRGWAIIEPKDVFDLILSDEYSSVSAETIKKSVEQISTLWKKELPLKTNIENMKEMNLIVGTAFPDLLKTDQEMFRIAHDIAILPQYDLATTVDDFMKMDNQNYEVSLFPVFSEYLETRYMNRRKLPNLGHLAFADEPRYVQSIHRFAMAVSSDLDDGGLALAANALPTPLAAKANPPVWKIEEYNELLQLRATINKGKKGNLPRQSPRQLFVAPPPPPGAPNNAQFGKICFNCGWNKNHNSKTCPVMALDPTKFTEKQRRLSTFDPKIDPHVIDRVPVNQSCAPGVYGN